MCPGGKRCFQKFNIFILFYGSCCHKGTNLLTILIPETKYTSTLQWPVTQDIAVEATLHYDDVGGYSVHRALVLAYGTENLCYCLHSSLYYRTLKHLDTRYYVLDELCPESLPPLSIKVKSL